MSQTKSSLILAQSSELAESFNLIAYYQDCMTLDSLFAEFEQAYEMLQAYFIVNKHRCKSYISTLLASCGISEEALISAKVGIGDVDSSGSFLKSIWIRIKNIFVALYNTIKTFFKRLFDINVRRKKMIQKLVNQFNIGITSKTISNIGGLVLTLPSKPEYQEIIDNLDSLYNKIHRIGISGDPSDITPYMQQSFQYFRINVRDGVLLTSIADLKPITILTKRLDDADPAWGWNNGKIVDALNLGTKMLLEILTKAESLNIQTTGLESECSAALRQIDQYSASGNVEDAIRMQDELYALQKRANFTISLNKIYQAYVSQLSDIFKNAWVNLNNFNTNIK